jgi:hypothetical protein
MSELRAVVKISATMLRRQVYETIREINDGGAPRVVTINDEPLVCIVPLPAFGAADLVFSIGGRLPTISVMENCDTIDPKYLDPGIRDVVTALWNAGLKTSDSGDGASKPPAGRDYEFEHVVIVPGNDDPWGPHDEMDRAIAVLKDVRPGEFWSARFTQELRTTEGELREYIFLSRHDGP